MIATTIINSIKENPFDNVRFRITHILNNY